MLCEFLIHDIGEACESRAASGSSRGRRRLTEGLLHFIQSFALGNEFLNLRAPCFRIRESLLEVGSCLQISVTGNETVGVERQNSLHCFNPAQRCAVFLKM